MLPIHYNQLKSDLPGSNWAIAAFLDTNLPPDRLELITSHCIFAYMKANAASMAPRGGASWQGGAETFINKGQNDRWRDTLSPADIAAYEDRALRELGPDCARWLSDGTLH